MLTNIKNNRPYDHILIVRSTYVIMISGRLLFHLILFKSASRIISDIAAAASTSSRFVIQFLKKTQKYIFLTPLLISSNLPEYTEKKFRSGERIPVRREPAKETITAIDTGFLLSGARSFPRRTITAITIRGIVTKMNPVRLNEIFSMITAALADLNAEATNSRTFIIAMIKRANADTFSSTGVREAFLFSICHLSAYLRLIFK